MEQERKSQKILKEELEKERKRWRRKERVGEVKEGKEELEKKKEELTNERKK